MCLWGELRSVQLFLPMSKDKQSRGCRQPLLQPVRSGLAGLVPLEMVGASVERERWWPSQPHWVLPSPHPCPRPAQPVCSE